MKTHPTGRSAFRIGKAFSLAELLVVIVIIGLLSAIMMPTITAILKRLRATDTKARIAALDNGAEQFNQEKNYYPGQDDYQYHSTGTGAQITYSYTGSQVLFAHLFGMYDEAKRYLDGGNPYHALDDPNDEDIIDGKPTKPKGIYVGLDQETYATVTGEGDYSDDEFHYTLIDCFSNPKAILYYMASAGIGASQFNYPQNEHYAGSTNEQKTSLRNMILDDRLDATTYGSSPDERPAVREGSFLLISAGIDQVYFSEDDLKNW